MNHEELLKVKLERIFPEKGNRKSALEILEAYGMESHEQEPFRVRLAVLKLSGPEIAQIEKWTRYAKEDFRDILSWAEYPRQSKKSPMQGGPENQTLIEADKREYEHWLNT